jgi:hypothetical protein
MRRWYLTIMLEDDCTPEPLTMAEVNGAVLKDLPAGLRVVHQVTVRSEHAAWVDNASPTIARITADKRERRAAYAHSDWPVNKVMAFLWAVLVPQIPYPIVCRETDEALTELVRDGYLDCTPQHQYKASKRGEQVLLAIKQAAAGVPPPQPCSECGRGY